MAAIEALLGLALARVPSRTPCPRCGDARFSVYQDLAPGDHWYACGACRFAGDIADLVAAVRRVSTAQVLSYLPLSAPARAALTTSWPHDRTGYEARRSAWRDTLDRAYKHFAKRFEGDTGGLPLSRGLISDLSAAQWRGSGLGQLGSGPIAALERSLKGSAVAFRGPGWGHGLVAPFELAPGLSAGAWLFGRAGELDKSTYAFAAGSTDAGLWGLPTLETGRWFGDGHTVFAMPAVANAAMLQARALRSSVPPLPLVVWADERTETANAVVPARTGLLGWQPTWDRQIVFLLTALTPSSLAQATLCDARIDLSMRYGDHADYSLGSRRIVELLSDVAKSAKSWARVAQKWAADKSPSVVADMVDAVRAAGGLADAVADATGCARPVERRHSSVVVRGRRFYAATSGWYLVRANGNAVRVWDRPFRLVQLEIGAGGSKYTVEVPLFGSEPLRFEAPFEGFELKTKQWLTRVCHAHGLPTPGGDAGARNVASLIEIAKAFHPPQEIRIATKSKDERPVDPVLGRIENVDLLAGIDEL